MCARMNGVLLPQSNFLYVGMINTWSFIGIALGTS